MRKKEKRADKRKMSDFPQFQRSKDHDPSAPVVIRKVSMKDMAKRIENGHDEGIGIY